MEKISISNIAWPVESDGEAVRLAGSLGFSGIELAPVKVFGPLAEIDRNAVENYRRRLQDAGMAIPALQAVLFGSPGLALFGDPAGRARLKATLERVATIAGWLGARACVFGAPALRDPGGLSAAAAFEEAAEFFRAVAPAFAAEATAIAFEANAPIYGCHFVTTTAEAIRFVKEVDSPGFRLQIDTGTIFIMNESPSVIAEAVLYAAHFHASEPQLAPLNDAAKHRPIAAALRTASYGGWRSVEMKASADWRDAMDAAAGLMRSVYS